MKKQHQLSLQRKPERLMTLLRPSDGRVKLVGVIRIKLGRIDRVPFVVLLRLVGSRSFSCPVCIKPHFVFVAPGESLLRRANFAARAGFFAGLRSAAAMEGDTSATRSRAMLLSSRLRGDDDFPTELDFYDDDLLESMVETFGNARRSDSANNNTTSNSNSNNNASSESVIQSLVMEVAAGMSRTGNQASSQQDGRQRLMEAARIYSQMNRASAVRTAWLTGTSSTRRAAPAAAAAAGAATISATTVDTTELLRLATAHGPHYRPKWWRRESLLLSSRAVTSGADLYDIEVTQEQDNIAHVPLGGSLGRAIRTHEPVPRQAPSPQHDHHHAAPDLSPSGSSARTHLEVGRPSPPSTRRVYGFRVAFDHPGRQPGENMGGCYLIGVTTGHFNNWGEQNGLQKSPLFWGIEDSGYKYEGTASSRSVRSSGSGRISSSGTTTTHYGTELNPREVPRNAADVIFGCRDVVTVVVDLDARTLTYWRNEVCLGTLVTKLPRVLSKTGSTLYPVVVPYNGGVTVAITGMEDDPLPRYVGDS
jgi:hypothetical protein